MVDDGCIHVVAAAVTGADGRVLIAQRPPGKHLAGSWEFPGGKLEAGESRAHGLARELEEELGIAIRQPRPLMRVRHVYPHGEVLIDMWVVSRFSGEPRGLDGQAIRWCTPQEVAAADLLPADRSIVRSLRLPERLREANSEAYEVTDLPAAPTMADRDEAARVMRLRGILCRDVEGAGFAAGRGADFIVLGREFSEEQLERLCASVSIPVFARGTSLEKAWSAGATGLNDIGS